MSSDELLACSYESFSKQQKETSNDSQEKAPSIKGKGRINIIAEYEVKVNKATFTFKVQHYIYQ